MSGSGTIRPVASRPAPWALLLLLALPATVARADLGAALQDLRFEPNRGQCPADVAFVARAADHRIEVTPSAFRLRAGAGAVTLSLDGGRADARVRAERPLAGRSHYLRGEDREAWITDVPHHARVVVEDALPGLDLELYGRRGHLEFDVVVHPGADPRDVAFRVDHADAVELVSATLLRARVGGEEVALTIPEIYQRDADGHHEPVAGAFTIDPDGGIRFELASYDAARPLVIDPVLDYATYLGGSTAEVGYDVAVDGDGHVYLTGTTDSTNFDTTPGAFDEDGRAGGFSDPGDAFVTKLAPDGGSLVWSTYLSGSDDEIGYDVEVDAAGNAVVLGWTLSDDFPTAVPFQGTLGGGSDLFVVKLDPTGSSLVYGTYLGGSEDDRGDADQDRPGLAVGDDGAVYVGGTTQSMDFPTTPGAFVETGNGPFVAKLLPDGSDLAYATLFGLDQFVFVQGLGLAPGGEAILLGFTGDPNLPTTAGSYQPVKSGGEDAFVFRMADDGSDVVWGTYVGGSDCDFAMSMSVDPDGSVWFTGMTSSPDYPSSAGPGAGAPMTHLSADGTTLLSSRVIGDVLGTGVAADALGRVTLVGNASDGSSTDVYLAHFGSDGVSYEFETYLGGLSADAAEAVVLDDEGHAILTGYTRSTSFPGEEPLNPPYQAGLSGNQDAFVVRYLRDDPLAVSPMVGGGGWSLAPVPGRLGAECVRLVTPEAASVTLRVHDVQGRTVAISTHDVAGAGAHDLGWDPHDGSPGVYFATVEARGRSGQRVHLHGRAVVTR